MTIQELRLKTEPELRRQLVELKTEIAKSRFERAFGRQKNVSLHGKARKTAARIQTILTAMKSAAATKSAK